MKIDEALDIVSEVFAQYCVYFDDGCENCNYYIPNSNATCKLYSAIEQVRLSIPACKRCGKRNEMISSLGICIHCYYK